MQFVPRFVREPCHAVKVSQIASELSLKFKNFLGGMPPDPLAAASFVHTAPGVPALSATDQPLSRNTHKLLPLPL